MPDNNFISAIRGYLRQGDFPLDASSVYDSLDSARDYALTNPTAYLGQLVAVVDEIERKVTVYQLGFKSNPLDPGFELQDLTVGVDNIIKTINNQGPDEFGNINIDLAYLDNLLTFLENTPERIVFNKPVSVPTESISGPDDVITRSYLEAQINSIIDGAQRTFKTTFGNQGGTTLKTLPTGCLIKRATLKINQPFNTSNINISVGGVQLFTNEDIFETEAGVYISEPLSELTGILPEYPVVISVLTSAIGLAELYIDFNINFIE